MIDVTTELLFQLIGIKEVEIVRLRLEVSRLTAALEEAASSTTPEPPPAAHETC